MITNENNINKLPENFKDEKKVLILKGLTEWNNLKDIDDLEILELVATTKCTERNLKKIRGIALLIVELKVPQEIASILLYAGISSSASLSKYSPQQLINLTGRLERQLNTTRKPLLSLKKAHDLIKLAKSRQNRN